MMHHNYLYTFNQKTHKLNIWEVRFKVHFLFYHVCVKSPIFWQFLFLVTCSKWFILILVLIWKLMSPRLTLLHCPPHGPHHLKISRPKAAILKMNAHRWKIWLFRHISCIFMSCLFGDDRKSQRHIIALFSPDFAHCKF